MVAEPIDCAQFRQFIDPYLDAEFDAEERAAFDAHLAVCGDCRRHYEHRAWMQGAIKPALKRPCRMPVGMRDRIHDRLRGAERQVRIRRAARKVAAAGSTAAAMAAVLLFVTPLTGFKPTVMADAVDQHVQKMPVEMPSPDGAEVEKWFEGKVPFEMAAPQFDDGRVMLLGGRISRVGGPGDAVTSRPAAYLIYGVGQHKMTVLVFDNDGFELDAPTTKINGKPVFMQDNRGYRVALFQRGSLAYAVTSDLPHDEMIRLIGTTL